MRLTTKRCYAVTAMLDVAMHQKQGPVSLADISKRRNISQSYLEQLFSKLRRKNLVKSVRGPGGGYVIAMDLTQLNVSMVIEAIDDERLKRTHCTEYCMCQKGNSCITKPLWDDVSVLLSNYLKGISYADLIKRFNDSNKKCGSDHVCCATETTHIS